jgi:hypothetical protein
MPIKFEEWPDARHLIFVNEWTGKSGRRIIFLIEGNCNMAECFCFISKYPVEEITAANQGLIPITTDVFENTVSVRVKGISTSYEGQRMPDWLEYITEEFGGRMRSTDAYTFHIMKHIVLSKTGELAR